MSPATKRWLSRWLWLTLAYFSLYITGSAPWYGVLPPAPHSTVTLGLLLMLDMAAVDCVILLALVHTSRLHGWRLMVLVAAVFYGVKTLSPTIEAVYVLPTVTTPLLPALFFSTVLLALGLGLLSPIMSRRLYSGDLDRVPGWLPLPMGWAEAGVKMALLGVVVYPALFFTFEYLVVFHFPAVRAFYGAPAGLTFVQHLAHAFRADSFRYWLEALRGLLWVALALPLLRTTRGPWWLGTLWVALLFAVVQNDALIIPSGLMPGLVRAVQFVALTSSNVIWAGCIGYVLSRSHLRSAPA